jgi:hypothetical protein
VQSPVDTGIWSQFADFVRRHIFQTRPRPFDYWIAQEIALVAGNNWIDQNNAISGRRGWAIVNCSLVAANVVWINSQVMPLAAHGGRVFANGGTFYGPIGSGKAGQQVHAWPFVAGILVAFYQFG